MDTEGWLSSHTSDVCRRHVKMSTSCVCYNTAPCSVSRPGTLQKNSVVAAIADRTAYDVRYTDKLSNRFRVGYKPFESIVMAITAIAESLVVFSREGQVPLFAHACRRSQLTVMVKSSALTLLFRLHVQALVPVTYRAYEPQMYTRCLFNGWTGW